jgi:hypothetical protein
MGNWADLAASASLAACCSAFFLGVESFGSARKDFAQAARTLFVDFFPVREFVSPAR